jgi:hypothetical protein
MWISPDVFGRNTPQALPDSAACIGSSSNFLRRIYDLLRPGGFVALITTNSIKAGDVRADGLEQMMKQDGNLNFDASGTKGPGVANLYVSLFSLHKGPWEKSPSVLDGRELPFISAFFEDYADAGKPKPLPENDAQVFQGSILLGDGFLLSHDEAAAIRSTKPRLAEVIFPVINGQELNNEPEQTPGRSAINFFDWSLEKASGYGAAFERVQELVKPERDKVNRAGRRERWWQYAERATGLYTRRRGLSQCLITAATTKHLNFSASPVNRVFTHAIYALTTERWCDYGVVQSTLHEVWARKYSGALETRLRYSPTDCFLTFPFPRDPASESALAAIGETYHEHRRALMRDLWVGLNDLAFGQIVEALSHSRFWKSMAIFGIEDDPQNGWDHVSGYRTTAYVISPWAKRRAVVSTQYNTTSLLRTMEQILGLPPMNQFDATATPMADCFTSTPDFTPVISASNSVAIDTMNPDPKAIRDSLLRRNAYASARLNFRQVDACPEAVLNRILWYAMKGSAAPCLGRHARGRRQ